VSKKKHGKSKVKAMGEARSAPKGSARIVPKGDVLIQAPVGLEALAAQVEVLREQVRELDAYTWGLRRWKTEPPYHYFFSGAQKPYRIEIGPENPDGHEPDENFRVVGQYESENPPNLRPNGWQPHFEINWRDTNTTNENTVDSEHYRICAYYISRAGEQEMNPVPGDPYFSPDRRRMVAHFHLEGVGRVRLMFERRD
jgi:hypothetical protein